MPETKIIIYYFILWWHTGLSFFCFTSEVCNGTYVWLQWHSTELCHILEFNNCNNFLMCIVDCYIIHVFPQLCLLFQTFLTNGDYLAILQQILLPIANEVSEHHKHLHFWIVFSSADPKVSSAELMVLLICPSSVVFRPWTFALNRYSSYSFYSSILNFLLEKLGI